MKWQGILSESGPIGDRLQKGLEKLDDGVTTVESGISAADGFSLPGEPEKRAREGLGALRSAVDWLEDSDYFDDAHRALDEAGRKVRQRFGCHLSFDWSEGYSQTCPVALAHKRCGLSIEAAIEEAQCSICQRDPDDQDCEHVTGQLYDGEKCLEIISRAKLQSANIVRRPKMPDARFTSLSVSADRLHAELGASFRYGVRVSCDRCLQDCQGMDELPPSGHT